MKPLELCPEAGFVGTFKLIQYKESYTLCHLNLNFYDYEICLI